MNLSQARGKISKIPHLAVGIIGQKGYIKLDGRPGRAKKLEFTKRSFSPAAPSRYEKIDRKIAKTVDHARPK